MTPTSPADRSRLGASFRDPSGFLFTHQGVLYRQVNQSYRQEFDKLVDSGLYAKLVKTGLLIHHEEVDLPPAEPELAYKILRPEPLELVSYPYEWCFSQLKDAALTTLRVQKLALEAGLCLKDSSAYNIQFHKGKPLLIDTLSFETYREGEPWVAYRQFCQHFLAPLALMAHCDVRLSQMLRNFIDGIPLDLASHLLPTKTKLDFGLSTHIHLHAAAQQRYAGKTVDMKAVKGRMSRTSFLGLMDSLESSVRKLGWKAGGTEWGDYYSASASHYTPAAFEHKRQAVQGFIERIAPRKVWDLGANTGEFSRLASQQDIFTAAFDIDPAAVELNYRACREKKETRLLPLLLDLTNPSPALGWANQERHSLAERGPADAVLALALVHHLAISNNVPLPHLAAYLHTLGSWLVIEFVPKGDSQVHKLLATRQDIFPDYTPEGFERAFSACYTIHERVSLPETSRVLYLMQAA
jgi:ribosomal protein L11 methylase PrmA